MSIGAVLVQGPGSQVPPRPDGDVPDHRHPHVRVGLQAERQDGDTNEEDRDYPNELDNEDVCNEMMINMQYLSSIRRVRFIKHGPDSWLRLLPPGKSSVHVLVLIAKPFGYLFLTGLLGV